MRRTALFLLGFLFCLALETAGEASSPFLNIQIDETGTAQVTAVVELSGTPAAARAVLMDYRRWPALFPHGVRIAGGRQDNGVVTTDMYLSRYFLPGELHLVTETRETEPGRLETRMIEGDFHRYRRVWRLTPVGRHTSGDRVQARPPLLDQIQTPDLPSSRTALSEHAEETHAELRMELQPKAWIPGWMLTIILKRELLDHFTRLQEAVAAAARQ
jgi:polyketide cyclase/dehydrase/lipid transport protein